MPIHSCVALTLRLLRAAVVGAHIALPSPFAGGVCRCGVKEALDVEGERGSAASAAGSRRRQNNDGEFVPWQEFDCRQCGGASSSCCLMAIFFTYRARGAQPRRVSLPRGVGDETPEAERQRPRRALPCMLTPSLQTSGCHVPPQEPSPGGAGNTDACCAARKRARQSSSWGVVADNGGGVEQQPCPPTTTSPINPHHHYALPPPPLLPPPFPLVLLARCFAVGARSFWVGMVWRGALPHAHAPPPAGPAAGVPP